LFDEVISLGCLPWSGEAAVGRIAVCRPELSGVFDCRGFCYQSSSIIINHHQSSIININQACHE
jgi:hypothetical protein